MTRHPASPHELARAAMESAIAVGQVAHHSGASEGVYRHALARLRSITGAARDTGRSVAVEIYRTSDDRWRAVVDTGADYWDSIIPDATASTIMGRGACG